MRKDLKLKDIDMLRTHVDFWKARSAEAGLPFVEMREDITEAALLKISKGAVYEVD